MTPNILRILATVAAAQAALAAAADDWWTGATFDAVLSDIDMPKMNGIELAKRFREVTGDSVAPIIILSAVMDLGTRIAGLWSDAFRCQRAAHRTVAGLHRPDQYAHKPIGRARGQAC